MGETKMDLYEQISVNVQSGNMEETAELTNKALSQNLMPQAIIDKGLIAGMSIIGEKYKNHEIFVPEMLIAARAMNHALTILEPHMVKGEVSSRGTLVIGTVKGDLHDIGKNLTAIMFKGAGYRVIDLGVDVSKEAFTKAAEENKADFVGLSALLSTTMANMKDIIQTLRENGITARVLVGGAALTEKYAREIGADGYAADAGSAIEVASQLSEGQSM